MRKWLPIALVLVIGFLFLRPYLAWLPYVGSLVSGVEDRSVYYRLKSSYMHGDERVDFDIVVGCAVHVTGYKDGSSSYDAFRDPVNYTKATRDGGAIMQLVPDACAGYTTASGDVPLDLLPGAIWFDNKDDFTLGIGYLSEDAYENPKSQLKFLGATIDRATREEWLAFRPILIQNLIEPYVFVRTQPWPSETEVRTNMWNKRKLGEWTRNSMECRGYARYRIEGAGIQAALKLFHPEDNPRFWVPTKEQISKINPYLYSFHATATLDGLALAAYQVGPYGANGFPTRTGGGVVLSNRYHRMPSKLFPMKADDGVPWARAELQSDLSPLYRDVDLAGGGNLGLTYCYAPYWGRGALGKLHLPNYRHRKMITRVDGVIVETDYSSHLPEDIPQVFFEGTEYLYIEFRQGLS